MKKMLPVVVIFLIGLAGYLWLQESGSIGTVNKTGLSKKEYEEKVNAGRVFYRYSKQDPRPGALEQSAIDSLITESLINEYVREKNITVADKEIGERYEGIVAGYNRNHQMAGTDETAFLEQLKTMYGIDKNDYLKEVKTDILKEKIQAKANMPFARWLENAKGAAAITINP